MKSPLFTIPRTSGTSLDDANCLLPVIIRDERGRATPVGGYGGRRHEKTGWSRGIPTAARGSVPESTPSSTSITWICGQHFVDKTFPAGTGGFEIPAREGCPFIEYPFPAFGAGGEYRVEIVTVVHGLNRCSHSRIPGNP